MEYTQPKQAETKLVHSSKKTKRALGLALGGLLLVGAGCSNGASTGQASPDTGTPTPTSDNGGNPTPVVHGNYKDGTYAATGDYRSPAGAEQIDVKLTLHGNVITDALVTPQATNPKSMRMQGMFTDNFKSYVVGMNLDEVHLSKVSGSSLTPGGFNDALEKIKEQAKSS